VPGFGSPSDRGWLWKHESGTYVKFTAAGATCSHRWPAPQIVVARAYKEVKTRRDGYREKTVPC